MIKQMFDTFKSWIRLLWRKTPISEKKPCDICQPPFKHFGKYYIMTEYPNDPGLYILRRDDAMGGVMIDYCPICGRKLEE